MRIPLGIAATDLDSGEGILFQRGDTGTAVRASSAVPAVFQPVRIGRANTSTAASRRRSRCITPAQMGAEFVIAVDISAVPQGNPTSEPARMLMQTFAIMGRSIKGYELREADLVLRRSCPACRAPTSRTRKPVDQRRARGGAGAARRTARAARGEEPALTASPSRRQARPSRAEMPSTGSTPTL